MTVVADFKYYKNEDISASITLPLTESIVELSHHIIEEQKLHPYEEDDLLNALENFVYSNNENHNDKQSNEALNITLCVNNDEDIIRYWEKQFKEETVSYGDKSGSSDSELFSTAYHKLVHSGIALDTMLQVEQSYAHDVAKLIQQRDEQIEKLTKDQEDMMNKKLEEVQTGNISSEEINNLEQMHIEQQSFMLVKWISKIDTLKETQRREFRDWVMKLLEEHQRTITLQSSFSSPSSPAVIKTFPPITSVLHETNDPQISSLEESFTIHLGSQMKQIYNIRILSANILDLCSIPYDTSNNEQQAQRIQTALALYTNDLCGTVLLTDINVDSMGVSKDFIEEASKSSDFHVDSIDKQLDIIKLHALDARSAENYTNTGSKKKGLIPGDVVITKHSNLCLAHLVFHMMVDESLYSSDMNSRHYIILAIRNIMKVCCSYDITTLTIPLLLGHEMTENMTVQWCTKRAELVLKCVKGFMIEMTSWGGSELKNLQFVVPKGISEEVFNSLATMLPSIFRVSNPLVFKVK
ncbi:hypothetical protein WDU94_009336 [Cyamophila willieti]